MKTQLIKYLLFSLLFTISCARQNQTIPQGNSIEQKVKKGEPLYFENVVFENDIDFTTFLSGNLISDGIYLVTIPSSVSFRNCTFKGKLSAYRNNEIGKTVLVSFLNNVSFIGCLFEKEVNFRGSNIYGKADFTKSIFENKVVFEEMNFYQNSYFNYGQFRGEVRFQNAFFMQKANFMNTKFEELASFQSTVFNSTLQFSVSEFFAYADLSQIECKSHVFFNYAVFHNKAIFNHSIFTGNLECLSSRHQQTGFANCKFMGKTKFHKTEVGEWIDFKDSFFLLGTPKLDFVVKGI